MFEALFEAGMVLLGTLDDQCLRAADHWHAGMAAAQLSGGASTWDITRSTSPKMTHRSSRRFEPSAWGIAWGPR